MVFISTWAIFVLDIPNFSGTCSILRLITVCKSLMVIFVLQDTSLPEKTAYFFQTAAFPCNVVAGGMDDLGPAGLINTGPSATRWIQVWDRCQWYCWCFRNPTSTRWYGEYPIINGGFVHSRWWSPDFFRWVSRKFKGFLVWKRKPLVRNQCWGERTP